MNAIRQFRILLALSQFGVDAPMESGEMRVVLKNKTDLEPVQHGRLVKQCRF
jgi:hypothetical protein